MILIHACPACGATSAVVARISRTVTITDWRGLRQRAEPAGFHCVCHPNGHAYWVDERGGVHALPLPQPSRPVRNTPEPDPERPPKGAPLKADSDMLWERGSSYSSD